VVVLDGGEVVVVVEMMVVVGDGLLPPLGAGIVVVGVGGATGLLGGDIGMVASLLGVTTLEDLESELLPTLLSATTVNSYGIPFVNPEIAHSAPIVVQVIFSGCEVTTYLLIGDPPFDFGADHFTTARALPAVACTERTAVGTEIFETAEAGKKRASERAKELTVTMATLVQRACANVLKYILPSISLEVISYWPVLLNKYRTDLQEC
jgi:hypothetical protein